ncbi:hypothetical protein AB205_0080390 [Aquarana catesbeiana]|uniref:Uncharacterized protein n=1 Tax=Aquarana catesbeiana TaxID=8400 RepID=A0A2G9RFY7_AQUCT|nr:hypothetical protein AB205_0080390 [Aquarana catesbeiana]
MVSTGLHCTLCWFSFITTMLHLHLPEQQHKLHGSATDTNCMTSVVAGGLGKIMTGPGLKMSYV